MPKPQEVDYPAYYKGYVERVPEGNLIDLLKQEMNDSVSFYSTLSEEQGNFRYAPDKWSIKDVVLHIIDCELVFLYRGISIGRGDENMLPGFEQNDWAANARADYSSMSDLLILYIAQRKHTIAHLKSLTDSDWNRTGNANGNPITVNAIGHIIVGHAMHHQNVIKEKYLSV